MSEFLQLSVGELEALELSYPLIKELKKAQPVLWLNPLKEGVVNTISEAEISTKATLIEEITIEEVIEANQRLLRFAPFIQRVFPETKTSGGLIESPLHELNTFMKTMMPQEMMSNSQWLVKLDSHLPISGSIKARGGIYEVLQHAERLAIQAGLLKESDDYSILAGLEFKTFFNQYAIAVGSTGNLGLSIGIMSAAFGFRVTVHMSSDAKQWKKDMLRSKGVEVFEYDADYSKAVEAGRAIADLDPSCYFVDDENSKTLFLGYATAALRLKDQLEALNIVVDSEHPMFVHLPCGVGGGPGGVAWGLQKFLGNHVHCFFAEPVQSPCMLLGMMTGKQDGIAVNDIGLTNKTIADGLAVGRASGFVGKIMAPFLSGIYTVTDEALTEALILMYETEGLKLEPSALAGTYGPRMLMTVEEGRAYYSKVTENTKKVTHISWATGGSMVPEEEFIKYMK